MALSPVIAQEENAQADLMHALSALYMGGKYSDVTITCNYRQWACHKAIICSRSGFFDGVCSSPFRESATGVIDLSEDDEEAVEQMIYFLYHLDYLHEQSLQQPSAMFRHRAYAQSRRQPAKKFDFSQIEDPLLAQAGHYSTQPTGIVTPPQSPKVGTKRQSGVFDDFSSSSPASPTLPQVPELDSSFSYDSESDEEDSTEAESHLILHTQVYALAEKYDIPALKDLARRKFEMAMACYYDAPEFAAAVEAVYCSTIDTDRGLREVVLQTFRTHPQLVHTQDVYAVIKDTPSLALELFKIERGIPV